MKFISILGAGVLASTIAAAQAFQGLSTTDDGSVLYFSTPDRIVGSSQSFHPKIFRWDAVNGFQLAADAADTGTSDGCTTSNFYQLSSPQVSGDGTILAYTGARPEAGGRFCTPSEPNQGIVQQNGIERTFTGSLSLSPNGRYAITTPADAVTNGYHFVTDLLSGSPAIVSGAFSGDRRRITDEGAVLSTEPSALVLTDRAGVTRVWQTSMTVSDAIVDSAGKTLVYLTAIGPNNPGAISTVDVPTGTETEIFTGFAPGNLYFTADGSHLLFTNGTSNGTFLYLIGVDGSGQRQIGTARVADAILSGDGTVVYANSANGGLIRIDVASGSATELAPPTPLITAAYTGYNQTTIAAAGSVVLLVGSALTDLKAASFCGEPVALIGGTAQFQVPWNAPEQSCEAIVDAASPFESAIGLTVQQFNPQFVAGGLFVAADFSHMIGATMPAHPGEVIVTYVTGLGPVDSKGLLTRSGFHCSFDSVPANLVYVGLAPGYLGVYQLNLQVPEVAQSSATVTCGWDESTESSTSIALGPS
jgi:uncharacterized protein (TIGR03437 family)